MEDKPKIIIYDSEIINCVPDWKTERDPAYKYCNGWGDYKGMGIAVICAFDFSEMRYRVFLEDNFDAFQELADSADIICGYNSHSFDDNLMEAHGIRVKSNYDLLRFVRVASGQPADFTRGKTKGGYTLGAVAGANFGGSKTEDGAHAPKMWQDGKHGRVIDYCLEDVRLTRRIIGLKSDVLDPVTSQMLSVETIPQMWARVQAENKPEQGQLFK